jgi:diguanylate cyclase (GGDEF)-like protein
MHTDMPVSTFMTTNVTSATAQMGLSEVVTIMLDKHYSCMVVVDQNMPIGIVTERDIVRLMGAFFADQPAPPALVGDVMSVPVATVTGDTTLFEALVISSAQKIRHLPVVDATGHLIGLITQSDLAKAHFTIYERQRDLIESTVSERTKQLLLANEQLKSLSLTDALTGLGNRRAMEVDLEHTHSQALRYNRSYSVALFDVDFFKRYNDHYGHKGGDEILRSISAHLQQSIRTCDRLYRYGGEEILLIMPETDLYGSLILADRILASLAEMKIPHEKSEFGVVTLSCGVASQIHVNGYPRWEDLVDLADRGLYASKNNGRNRSTIIPPEDAVNNSVPRMHGNN